MTFKKLAEYFSKLEKTASRLKMTEILSELFREAGETEIGQICFLLQGRIAPQFVPLEFGMADKMLIRAVAVGMNTTVEDVTQEFKKIGDIGEAIYKFKVQRSQPKADPPLAEKLTYKNFQVSDVYNTLFQVATSSGEGSQEDKIRLLGNILQEIDPLSARFIVSITLGKLRLGFSDMTILDSLSWMIDGNKTHRGEIERAYNVRPDLSFISTSLKKKGIIGLKSTQSTVGTPILMARAERMSTGVEIIEKIGRCAVEPKYDGFRLQVHYNTHGIETGFRKKESRFLKLIAESEPSEKIRLFSRNLEDVTAMYPDIIRGVEKQITAELAIFEGEAIAFNPATGEYLPFQETVQRKRKYDITLKAKEVPLKLFAFDLLYLDGESLLTYSYVERRKALENLIKKGETILVAREDIVDDPIKLEQIFEKSVSEGLEGVMAKKMDGTYRAGSRDFNWIKYKRSYAGKLADTIDAVVMGYDFGQGKRTGFGIGGFLIGVLSKKKDAFVTMAKIGTGLTDEEWKTLEAQSSKLKSPNKPKNYEVDKMMECDIWIHPKIVVEIRADEITKSPVHTANFALRFPRLERFRQDKSPSEVTTLSEVEKMYKSQSS